MAFSASAGRILITDPDDADHVVFDSDEGLFLGTDLVSGSVNTPQRVAVNNGSGGESVVNVDTLYNLGSINALADTVVGSFKVTVSGGGQGVANLGWFSAGGSYVHYWGRTRRVFEDFWFCHNKAAYTFFADSGTLYLRENVGLRADGLVSGQTQTTITLKAITFDYTLFVGAFV